MKAAYIQKHLGITSKLTDEEVDAIVRLLLLARDLEMGGESVLVTRDAKELGVKTDWR